MKNPCRTQEEQAKLQRDVAYARFGASRSATERINFTRLWFGGKCVRFYDPDASGLCYYCSQGKQIHDPLAFIP